MNRHIWIGLQIEETTSMLKFRLKKISRKYSKKRMKKVINLLKKHQINIHNIEGMKLLIEEAEKQKRKDIECNILQVCDAFDCMISGMECKRISVQQALETMIEAADLLFERKIVKVLQKIVAYYPVGTKIRLNTGETGIVVCQTDNSIRPVVAVLDQDNQMTEIRYDLAKNKKISILQLV